MMLLDSFRFVVETDMGGGDKSSIQYGSVNVSTFQFDANVNMESSWVYESQYAYV